MGRVSAKTLKQNLNLLVSANEHTIQYLIFMVWEQPEVVTMKLKLKTMSGYGLKSIYASLRPRVF